MKKLPQNYAFFECLFPPSLGGSISNSEKKTQNLFSFKSLLTEKGDISLNLKKFNSEKKLYDTMKQIKITLLVC